LGDGWVDTMIVTMDGEIKLLFLSMPGGELKE
jgi:hypothetical protein